LHIQRGGAQVLAQAPAHRRGREGDPRATQLHQGHLCRVLGDLAQLQEALTAAEARADCRGTRRLFDPRVTAVRHPLR